MTDLFFPLRVMSLLATACLNLLRADPRGFLGKVAERIRQSGQLDKVIPTGWLTTLSGRTGSQTRQLIDAGHLTAGIQHVLDLGAKATAGDIHLAKRTIERILQLELEPASGRPLNEPSDGKVRVLHVLTNSKPHTSSGYTVRSQHVLECQIEAGLEVEAVTRLGYPVLIGKLPRAERQRIASAVYHRMLPWFYPVSLQSRDRKSVEFIVKLAREMGATALQTTTDYPNAVVVSEAARILGIPWVYEVRGELENTWVARRPTEEQTQARRSEFYRLARAQETRCMKAASAVVVLSDVSRSAIVDRGVHAEKLTVVPNAVDEALIAKTFDRDKIRRELRLPQGCKLVGSVTSVVDYEGLDTLIAAIPAMSDDWQVLIVGDGIALPWLQRQAEALGVSHRVTFAGKKPSREIWKWYASLDAFVVPRKDTTVTRHVTPIKPLIAMALGIPVVASDLPALRDVTANSATYVTPGHPEELAQIINAEAFTRTTPVAHLRTRTWTANGQHYSRLYRDASG